MDFIDILVKDIPKSDKKEIIPVFRVAPSKDLMIRGGEFYAVWDELNGIWSKDLFRVRSLIDHQVKSFIQQMPNPQLAVPTLLENFNNGYWTKLLKYLDSLPDYFVPLDERVCFADTVITKQDYISVRLPYCLQEGSISSYDAIMSTLYEPKERDKIEWYIGSIIDGASIDIHKFLVLYGAPGTGKSTVINIIQSLLQGHYIAFDAKTIGAANKDFALSVFENNPLLGIQHDADLSNIEDNTKLNSITAHEEMAINVKYKRPYTIKLKTSLILGTNTPVKITDINSGIVRRLIDVNPSGTLLSVEQYYTHVANVKFELGAIAHYCKEKYNRMGKNYYNGYRAISMMYKTDEFFNFVEENYFHFRREEYITLQVAYTLYKEYCENTNIKRILPQYKFREELKKYFKDFHNRTRIDGIQLRNVYMGLMEDKFDLATSNEYQPHPTTKNDNLLSLPCTTSVWDTVCAEYRAQYANEEDYPKYKWDNVTTTLKDLDTSKTHYVLLPDNHIVIDFDIKDENGKKSLTKNLEAAAKFPPTYSEISKGGNGVHLHYFYTNDVDMLAPLYDKDIEIKVYRGKGALRRRVSMCNDLPIASINSGLPLRKEKKMINKQVFVNEQGLRTSILKALRGEVHANTAPNIDFIHKILEEAYESGIQYDVTDMQSSIIAYAKSSTNQAEKCLIKALEMKYKSDIEEFVENTSKELNLMFYDVEVFKNVFIIAYKQPNKPCKYEINPSKAFIETLLTYDLVGFNNRRYDNHILYGWLIGYSNIDLYNLSQKIIAGVDKNCMFREAYNISYADILDYSSKKQSLKKFEIDLGLKHLEFGHPWDLELPEEQWIEAAEYCINDVVATEAVFYDPKRQADYKGRLILAELSSLTPNHSTLAHVTKIIFGDDPNPQKQFNYVDLSIEFPGYKYEFGKSTYRGFEVGEGGFVWSAPGMYALVDLDDVESMHPGTIEILNFFGKYTYRYNDIKYGRVAVKTMAGIINEHLEKGTDLNVEGINEQKELLTKYLDGQLKKYITDNVEDLENLSYALKIIINIVYGLTAAKFDCKFKDPRNVDNIVAKRGALFMIDLYYALQERGTQLIHIKTDSVKIANATDDDWEFIYEFGRKYGYKFVREHTYDALCLVNDAVYVARSIDKKKGGIKWTATGTQFKVPYVFKTLFSGEEIEFKDMCETKAVKGKGMYLDMNEQLEDTTIYEKELDRRARGVKRLDTQLSHMSDEELQTQIENGHQYQFIGKVGMFCPIVSGGGGGILVRDHENKNGVITKNAVTDTTGFRWLEATTVQDTNKEHLIDLSYYTAKVEAAKETISQYGDLNWFLTGEAKKEQDPFCYSLEEADRRTIDHLNNLKQKGETYNYVN